MQNSYWKHLIIGLIVWLAVAGCGGQASDSATPGSEGGAAVAVQVEALPESVDAATVQQIYTREHVVIVDVRTQQEYDGGHIPGARLIPLDELPNRLDEIPTDQTVVTVCRSGNRSGQALNLLRREGFDNIHNMAGGMISWRQQGYDVEQ